MHCFGKWGQLYEARLSWTYMEQMKYVMVRKSTHDKCTCMCVNMCVWGVCVCIGMSVHVYLCMCVYV